MLLGKLLYLVMMVMYFNHLLSNGTLSAAWRDVKALWATLWATLRDMFG